MYQCRFFYQEDPGAAAQEHVRSAFSVTADSFYHYDTEKGEDSFYYPEGTVALIRTVSGCGQADTRTGPVRLEKDSFLILPLAEIRRYSARGDFWTYFWINFTAGPGLHWTDQPQLFPFTEYEREILDELLRAGEENLGGEYVDSIFRHLLFRLICGKWTFPIRTEKPETGQAIKAYIDQKYFYRLRITQIAEFFGLSPRRLNQIFHQEFHQSPKKYILRLKIRKAKELLVRTDLRIGEIAANLSFDSAYHFSNTFKRETGMPPSLYRKRMGEHREE